MLRPYQEKAISDVRDLFRSGVRRVLLHAPTGAGKTVMMADIFSRASAKGAASWMIVHRRELVSQTSETFAENGIPHNLIAAGFKGDVFQRNVKICSIGTLARRVDALDPPKLIAWDEAHHIAAASWDMVFKKFPNAYHVGLTATPLRLDGKGLGNWFQSIVHAPSTNELIMEGYLSNYTLFGSKIDVSLDGVKTTAGDYDKHTLAVMLDTPSITGDAVAHYIDVAMGKRAIAFCVSIEHSENVAADFCANGIPAAHVDAGTPKEERESVMRKFRDGEILIVCNVDLFGEGVDVPAVECVICLRPTKSLSLCLQQWGRGLRRSPGKERCIILDHANNWQTHGLPDTDREWSLEGIKKKPKESVDGSSLIRRCMSCYAINPITAKACFNCGESMIIGGREVTAVAGKLEEVNQEDLRLLRRKEVGSARDYESLVKIGYQRNYKNPKEWAKHVINGRMQKWGSGTTSSQTKRMVSSNW